MTKLELKNHRVWQDLTEVLANINANALVREHLESCDYKICGYWDEQDKFYEEITLPHSWSAELVSSSIGMTNRKRWINLKFVLKIEGIALENSPRYEREPKIGEMTLIYNENLEFLDENWQIDINFLRTITNHLSPHQPTINS